MTWANCNERHHIGVIMAKVRLKNLHKIFRGKTVKLSESMTLSYDKRNGWCEFCFHNLIIDRPTSVIFEFEHVASNQNKAKVFEDYIEIIHA